MDLQRPEPRVSCLGTPVFFRSVLPVSISGENRFFRRFSVIRMNQWLDFAFSVLGASVVGFLIRVHPRRSAVRFFWFCLHTHTISIRYTSVRARVYSCRQRCYKFWALALCHGKTFSQHKPRRHSRWPTHFLCDLANKRRPHAPANLNAWPSSLSTFCEPDWPIAPRTIRIALLTSAKRKRPAGPKGQFIWNAYGTSKLVP